MSNQETDYIPQEDHEIAELLPPMAQEEYTALVEDIKKNGLREPIVTLEGRILDGRHRARACADAGIKPRFREYNYARDGESPVQFVLSQNVHRRHLNSSQRAVIAADALPLYEKEAAARRSAALRQNRPSAPIDANGAAPAHKGEESPAISTKAVSDENLGKSAEHAAKLTGASPRQVERARLLSSTDHKALEQVRAGKKSLHAALQSSVTNEAYEEALARIEKVCGEHQVGGIRQGAILPSPKEVIEYAALSDDQMLAIRSLIDQGWKVRRAVLYKAKTITPQHRVMDLINRAISEGGKYEQDVEDHTSGTVMHITVTLVPNAKVKPKQAAAKLELIGAPRDN